MVEDSLPAGLKGRRRAVVAGMLAGEAYEQPLAKGLREQLERIPGVTLYGPPEGQPADVHSVVHARRLPGRTGVPRAGSARPLHLGRRLLRTAARRTARPAVTWRTRARGARPVHHGGRAGAPRRTRSATSPGRCDDRRPGRSAAARAGGRRSARREPLHGRLRRGTGARGTEDRQTLPARLRQRRAERSASCSPPRSVSSPNATACVYWSAQPARDTGSLLEPAGLTPAEVLAAAGEGAGPAAGSQAGRRADRPLPAPACSSSSP